MSPGFYTVKSRICAVRKSWGSSLLVNVFTSRTRRPTRERSGAPEYAMVVFTAPQLREYEAPRNDPSNFEGRARTNEAVVKTKHPGDSK